MARTWEEPGAAPPRPRAAPGPGRGPLGNRRNLLVIGIAGLLLVAVIAVAVIATRGGGDGKTTSTTAPAPFGAIPGAGSTVAPGPGKESRLLKGRLVVAGRPGWEPLEQSDATGTVKLALQAPGRELLSTLVVTALSGANPIEGLLSIPDGQGFTAPTSVGPLKATAAPGPQGRVVAAIVRPGVTIFLSLSVFATDGKGLDVPLLQRLFTEQVAPALKFA